MVPKKKRNDAGVRAARERKSASSEILNKIAEKMVKAPTKVAALKLKDQYLSAFYGAPKRSMKATV